MSLYHSSTRRLYYFKKENLLISISISMIYSSLMSQRGTAWHLDVMQDSNYLRSSFKLHFSLEQWSETLARYLLCEFEPDRNRRG